MQDENENLSIHMMELVQSRYASLASQMTMIGKSSVLAFLLVNLPRRAFCLLVICICFLCFLTTAGVKIKYQKEKNQSREAYLTSTGYEPICLLLASPRQQIALHLRRARTAK